MLKRCRFADLTMAHITAQILLIFSNLVGEIIFLSKTHNLALKFL